MALIGDGAPKTLADVLGSQAPGAEADINNQYARQRKQTIAQQAHLGRGGSAVSNYQMGDLASAQAGDIAGVESGLASALGQVPAEDYYNNLDFQRKQQLAQLLGGMNKPSSLQEALGGLGTAAQLGATFAAFA